MRRTLALLVALSAAAVFGACSSGDGEGGTLDIGGELAADVPAHEIDPYEERPEDFCKGQIRREEFSNWDWQCEDVMGLGKCVVISENHGYQCIRQLQMARAGRSFGTEFRKRDDCSARLDGDYLDIDFAKNAESMGARAWHVTTPDGLSQALREARDEARACVIVVEVEKHRYLPDSGIWWDIAVSEATNDPVTRRLREEYEEDRDNLQRYYYR